MITVLETSYSAGEVILGLGGLAFSAFIMWMVLR